jgi:hypothetical protein
MIMSLVNVTDEFPDELFVMEVSQIGGTKKELTEELRH